MEIISRLEVKVDSIRQAMLGHNLEYPWVVLFKSISNNGYLPVYVSNGLHSYDWTDRVRRIQSGGPSFSLLSNSSSNFSGGR